MNAPGREIPHPPKPPTTHLWSCALSLLLVLSVSAPAQSRETGFFSGPRARIVELLGEAWAEREDPSEALGTALRAQELAETANDPYADLFINQILAHLHLLLGDAEQSSIHLGSYTAIFAEIIEADGIAQTYYTTYLFHYDLAIEDPGTLNSSADVTNADMLGGLRQLVTILSDQLEDDAAEGDVEKVARLAEDLQQVLTDLMAATANKDASRLKKVRKTFRPLFKDFISLMQLDREESEIFQCMADIFDHQMGLAIAALRRNRRKYERSVTEFAAALNCLLELGVEMDAG